MTGCFTGDRFRLCRFCPAFNTCSLRVKAVKEKKNSYSEICNSCDRTRSDPYGK
jgi:hypothetical protein